MKQESGSDGSISHLFKRREDPVKEEMNAIEREEMRKGRKRKYTYSLLENEKNFLS
jgi:hypothetical protein